MVTTELRGEKVDIVPFSDDPAEFVSRALQPAKVKEVILAEDTGRATVIVHDYQLSLAIGKEGQNARLAARLTGWHIDIKSESEVADEAHFAEGEWAEGEWVEQSGEMVWKPAEGGETLSAEAWAAGETPESDGESGEGLEVDVAIAEELVVEPVEADPETGDHDAGLGTKEDAVSSSVAGSSEAPEEGQDS
jgi:N utilization substance protein A